MLAILSALGSSDRAAWLWGFGAVGVLATVVALAGWAGATWWGVFALGAEYTACTSDVEPSTSARPSLRQGFWSWPSW